MIPWMKFRKRQKDRFHVCNSKFLNAISINVFVKSDIFTPFYSGRVVKKEKNKERQEGVVIVGSQ